MTRLDRRESQGIFVRIEGIDPNEYIIVHYRVVVSNGSTIEECAARLATLTSLGTMSKLPYEDTAKRISVGAKVLRADESGEVVIAFPLELCSPNEGLTQLLTIVFYGASFNYTRELWVENIDIPKAFARNFKGPRLGIAGVREKFGIHARPPLGVIMKPRLGVSLAGIAENCSEALLGGADFVVDDELLLDREGELAFENRVSKMVGIVENAEKATGERKWYTANIAASPLRSMRYARIAHESGASGVLVNAFTMGFSTVDELVNQIEEYGMVVVVHNMGVGILTRPLISESFKRPTGVSHALIPKLSRMVGGDAVHGGISHSEWYHKEAWGSPIVALRSGFHEFKPSFAVAAGGLTVENAWENIASLGPDVILEAGNGILGYPSGPRHGAEGLRKLIKELSPDLSSHEAQEKIAELGDKDKWLQDGLRYYGYGRRRNREGSDRPC